MFLCAAGAAEGAAACVGPDGGGMVCGGAPIDGDYPCEAQERDGGPEFMSPVCSALRAAQSPFGSAIDEAGDVGLELDEILIAEIHHVSRVVVLQANVLLEFVRQSEMLHGVFGGVERCGQIVKSVLHFNLEMRIGEHGPNQVA